MAAAGRFLLRRGRKPEYRLEARRRRIARHIHGKDIANTEYTIKRSPPPRHGQQPARSSPASARGARGRAPAPPRGGGANAECQNKKMSRPRRRPAARATSQQPAGHSSRERAAAPAGAARPPRARNAAAALMTRRRLFLSVVAGCFCRPVAALIDAPSRRQHAAAAAAAAGDAPRRCRPAAPSRCLAAAAASFPVHAACFVRPVVMLLLSSSFFS